MVGWLWTLLACQATALFFTLTPGKERCVGISLEPKVEYTGAYVFTGENEQNVIARVKSPGGYIVHQSPRGSREGKFEFSSSEDGIHRLCFRGTDNTEKIISFDFSRKSDKVDVSVVTDEELGPLGNGLSLMGKKFDIIYRNIHFYQLRERTHRDLTERTCDRILWSAIGKMGILGAICLTQIYILKTLFAAKSAQGV